MSIFKKLQQHKIETGMVKLIEKISKDSNFRIDSSNQPFKHESSQGLSKNTGTRSYTIKSDDEKNVIEIVQHYSRTTGGGTKGLYALNINGNRQKLDQKKLEKLFQFMQKLKSDDRTKQSTQNPEELVALLQKYVHE